MTTGEEAAAAAAPAPPAGDTVTLPKGRILIDAYLGIDLSKGLVGKPLTLSPDIWYGISDKLTVGLVHSTLGETGFIGAGAVSGNSLCLTGSDNGCGKFYNNVGLDVRYNLKQADFSYAFDGGLNFRSLSPSELAVKVGAVARWHKAGEKLAIELEPALYFGLTNRKVTTTVGGVTETVTNNGDSLGIPVTVLYNIAPKIDIAGQTGVVIPFENTSDAYYIPLAVGANYHLSVPASLNLAFAFPALIGGAGSGNFRTLTLGGSYAF